MTKPQSIVEMTRHDAQELHKRISANIAKAEHATWADVKTVQGDVNTLASKMKALATDQVDEAKAAIKTAISKLEAAGRLIENKAAAAKDAANEHVRRANAAMLESALTAEQSLSAAVAAARTNAARAIEPKKANA